MVNLKEKELILLYEYLGHGDVCCDCCKEILELIEPADAIIAIDDMPFIDIDAYDRFILSHLGDLRKEAEMENAYAKAYEYVCAADDYNDDRCRFIDLMTFRYADRCPNKRQSFKRNYEFASANLGALFGHYIYALDLLFKSTPTPADYHNPIEATAESTNDD